MTPKVSTKNNLRRNIENTFSKKFIFVNIDKILYLYPNTLTMKKLVVDFISIQSAMNERENKVILTAAVDIRKQIKLIRDEIPWPPSHKIFPLINLKCQRDLKRFSTFFILLATKKKSLIHVPLDLNFHWLRI